MYTKRFFLKACSFLLILTACSSKVENTPTTKTLPSTDTSTTSTTQTDNSTLALSCAAQTSSSSVSSGSLVSITVQAAGGSGPYKLENYGGSFSSSKTITKTYTNAGSSAISITDTFQIIDAAGHNAQCDLPLTVNPVGTIPSDLACQVSVSPSSPHVSEAFEITVSAAGGNGIYSFGSVSLGADGSFLSAVSPISSSAARGTAKYTVAALKTIQASVTDSSGASVNCSTPVTIRPAVSVSLSASPSTSVNVGSSITLSPSSSGFIGTVTYQFSHTEAGVQMTLTSGGVVFTATDGLAHNYFTVSVTASASGETATSSIQLRFTNPSTLSCTLTRTGSTLLNQTVNFAVTAGSEPLEITEFYPDSGATITSTATAGRSVKYSSTGTKNVYVRARSIATGQYCNGGNYLQSTFSITAAVLACSAYTTPNTSYTGDWVGAGATVTGGYGPFTLFSVCTTTRCFYPGADSLAMYLKFSAAGSYHLTMTVYDAIGNSTTCSTDHTVYQIWY